MLTTEYETVTGNTATDRQGRAYDVYGDRRFRLRPTGRSSVQFGPCEICKAHVSETYIQAMQTLSHGKWIESGYGLLGHRECLLVARAAA